MNTNLVAVENASEYNAVIHRALWTPHNTPAVHYQCSHFEDGKRVLKGGSGLPKVTDL